MNILFLIGWLYLIQGIPYGIQDKFIPILLHQQKISFTNLTLMKGLLFPWICKGIWAPIIQIYLGPHFWLVFSVIGLTCVSAIGCFLQETNLFGLSLLLFVMNILSAMQDVVVDGMAVNALKESQLGIGNSIQVVLYKIGSLLGGAGLIYLWTLTNWSFSFGSVSLVYLFTVLFLVIKRNDLKRWMKIQNHKEDVSNKEPSTPNVMTIIREVLCCGSVASLSTFVAIYKMGERGAANMLPLFLLEHGVSPNRIALWGGFVGQTASVAGSIFAGKWMTSTITDTKMWLRHRTASVFLTFFVVALWPLLSSEWDNMLTWFGLLSGAYLSFSAGGVSVVVFTLMMERSRTMPPASRASAYSMLASIEVFGKLAFATFSGALVDYVGLETGFFIFSVLSYVPFLLL